MTSFDWTDPLGRQRLTRRFKGAVHRRGGEHRGQHDAVEVRVLVQQRRRDLLGFREFPIGDDRFAFDEFDPGAGFFDRLFHCFLRRGVELVACWATDQSHLAFFFGRFIEEFDPFFPALFEVGHHRGGDVTPGSGRCPGSRCR